MFERKYPKFVFSNLGQRFIAYIIDLIIVLSVGSLIINIGKLFGIEPSSGFFSFNNLVRLVIYLAYFTLITKFTNGYTLGKAIMGLKVVSFIEDELSWGTVLTRELFAGFIMYEIKVLYLLPVFTEYKQNLGDLLADTSVVKLSYLEEIENIFLEKGFIIDNNSRDLNNEEIIY